MVRSLSLKNFRAFMQSGPVPLSPVTFIVGRNSSGKSSVLNALLLLKQSTEQRAMGSRIAQLNLNGPYVDAGSYADIIHGHDETKEIGFGFEITINSDDFRQIHSPRPSLVEIDVPRPSISRYGQISYRDYYYGQAMPRVKEQNIHLWFYFHPEKPFGPTISRVEVDAGEMGSVSFKRTAGERRVQHWRAYIQGFPESSLEIRFPLWSFFPAILPRRRSHSAYSRTDKTRLTRFVFSAQAALQSVERLLLDLRMVGPFRTTPERRYTFTGFGAVDTGTTGERAIDLLITERLVRPGKERLKKAVSFWLNKLGLAKSLSISTLAQSSNIFELNVAGAGIADRANFADVGFGVSQVLPVLIQGFLVPQGGTYLVQQPELHLHPDAQAGLADYFLYLASQGIRVLVETHSEYLLLRLRRRMAEGIKKIKIGIEPERAASTQPIGKEDIAVVYVGEKAEDAAIQTLEIGDSFQFDNMPIGFMDQAISDRLSLMKALSRKK